MKKIIAFLTSHDILILTVIASVMSIAAILYFFSQDQIILYGDAESHLNISKRVVSSITPGLAQPAIRSNRVSRETFGRYELLGST